MGYTNVRNNEMVKIINTCDITETERTHTKANIDVTVTASRQLLN